MTTKKKLLICACVVVTLLVLTGVWNIFFSATRVAFVNYQVISLGEISKANDNPSIKLSQLGTDNLDKIGDYDMVFINAMGLRITEDQRALIEKAARKGVPIMTTAATNPANLIISVDSIQADTLRAYLTNGGRRNYRSMLNYVRNDIDGKRYNNREPEPVVARANDMLYHKDPDHPDDEELGFNSVAEYDAFLEKHGLLKDGAPRVIVTGLMGEPTDLIARLEATGNVVYAVRSIKSFVTRHHIDSVSPSAIINMAHGRMGDYMVDYLKEQNIPLFAPLNINRLVDEWEEDKMGMSGGFLSQSVVTPEIDGALRPYVLFGNYMDDEGLQHTYAIPDRLEKFVETVNNYISLKTKPNSEKRIAIYYYKGPGQSAMTAAGMEVAPSLYNLLRRLRQEGYDVDSLPSSPKALEKKIQEGDRLLLGNIALLRQPMAGEGTDTFKIVHGTEADPPATYINSYQWTRNEFKADALIHFGTHGSLEFTPRKQTALGNSDWPDSLVGTLPHFYVYTIADVGEGVIAKRRAYAGLQSHITPPFMESNLRDAYKQLTEAIRKYNNIAEGSDPKADDVEKASLLVKKLAVEMGIHKALCLDSILTRPYTAYDIQRIESFGEEIVNEKITGQLYTMGIAYEPERITSSVYAIATDPIAYSLLALDKLRGKAAADLEKHQSLFSGRYLTPARKIVGQLLSNPQIATDDYICRIAGITQEELLKAREIDEAVNTPVNMMEIMTTLAEEAPAEAKTHAEMPSGMHQKMMEHGKNMDPKQALKMAKMMGADKDALKRMEAAMNARKDSADESMAARMRAMTGKKDYPKEDLNKARAIMEVERTLKNVGEYKRLLLTSPEAELASLVNALNGGYTAPSPGGDLITNPNTLPTGRNLFAINAEETPTEEAWEKGKQLADNTIEMYRQRHNDSLPRKVSYTLWSGEFIETGGATIAQVLYMLGVEPIRDTFGRVTDIRLIPSDQLGRPRIDVVVQTSGQLRDIAASRLFLVNRAVEMAAAADDDKYENQVAAGVVEAERVLIEKGLTPKEARKASTYRVFGGLNGNYGTGIQQMVNAGDKWQDEAEIASVYLNNMGAYYGSEEEWEKASQYAFEAALTRTDAVVQPRQSNTWGALSLDHVYEFMGGMNLAVRNVTGKDPDAYLSDYRNRNNARMQEVKEAIGVESRTTLFNPTYIKEKMKGGATSASTFAELIRNTYGWNVMKPAAIDNEMWDEIYSVYVKDKYNLGVQDFFERESPAALEDITAVMMESANKGYWKASKQQLDDVSALHASLEKKYGRQPRTAEEAADNKEGKVLKKETLSSDAQSVTKVSNIVVALIVVVALVALIVIVRRRRKSQM